MNLSDMSARVRLNMKRSPFESQGDRPKQRRVTEGPEEDEVMDGEVQVNEEVEQLEIEVMRSETKRPSKHVGYENNDFCNNTNSSVVQFGFGIGSKTYRVGKITNRCVSQCFLHAEMKDDAYIKLDAATLRMIHEEK